MPEITVFAGQVAGIISLIAFIPYVITIFRGETIPNRATWWIWTIVGFMLGASYFASGAHHTIWVPISYIIGPLVIAFLSIKHGEGGWTKLDRTCLLSTAVSLILWWVFSSPLVALLINLFIDSLGAIPTTWKAYREPENESRIAWALFFLGAVINLFAVEKWTFAIAVYPVYMFFGVGLITVFVFFRPRKTIL